MTLPITRRTQLSLQKTKKEPSLIVIFDGIDQIFGSAVAYKNIRIGDPGLVIGDDWVIGGRVAYGDQITAIAFQSDIGSSSTTIDYNLKPDQGLGESVTSMVIALVDDQAHTILGLTADHEFMGRKCRVLLSPDPNDTIYPDDYITIFRGIVDDINFPVGGVVLTISHPDQKKRQSIYTSVEGELTANVVSGATTTISLDDASNLLLPAMGPDGITDNSFTGYIQIEDEIIEYTSIVGNDLVGCVRGSLGTIPGSYATGTSFKSFYRIQGNSIDMALKLMLSGWHDYFATGVDVTNFNYLNPTDTIPNMIYFDGINVEEMYGLTAGDYITTSGAANGANNVTLEVISEVVLVEGGSSYIVVSGVSFVNESDSAAVISFRSKYDSLPDGLGMSPDEVDVYQHEYLRDLFLSSFNYDAYLKESMDDAKDFISTQIYRPIACYSVPRKARSSVAFHIGPLPTQFIKTLDTNSVKNAKEISVRRSLGRNFYNTVIYKFDIDSLKDKFLKGVITLDGTSHSTIPVGNRSFIVEAPALRDGNVAQSASSRRLNRYAFGAQYINNVKTTFGFGFNLEVSDLVIVDGVDLKLPNFDTGDRDAESKLYEIVSKKIDLATGDITLGLIDTNYNNAGRYGLISPASVVRSGTNATSFDIQESYSSVYGANEYMKWDRYDDLVVRVRNSAYSTAATARVAGFSGNTVNLLDTLGFTPSAGMIMELSDYNQMTEQIKLLYVFHSNGSANFADGKNPYFMI